MSEELELRLIKQIEDLQKQVNKLEGKNEDGIPTYSFSSITDKKLKQLVNIKEVINDNIFNYWFNYELDLNNLTIEFLIKLINKNKSLIRKYNEEDLKVKFIIPLINDVDFLSYKNEFRDFYELPLTYKTDNFIFTGTTDFVVSKGLIDSEKPYFFIQEFKKNQTNGYPEPQLLAELIAGVELNNETIIKGAYIVGAIWNFVILEKLGKDKYQYFVSQNFDSTKIEDLKGIYKNLVFVKNEIITKIEEEDNK